MRCAYLSFQPFLDPLATGQTLASAAMLDAVSALADVVLVCLTPSDDLQETSRLLRQRFPAVCAVELVGYRPRVPRRTKLRYAFRCLPASLGALDSAEIRRVVAEIHRDRSIDVVHYDLMTWLHVHPDPSAPTVCSAHDCYSLAYRVKARFARGPVEWAGQLIKALAFERFERRYLRRADVVHMVSAEDVRYLRDRGIGGVLRAVNMPIEDRWLVSRRDGPPLGRNVLTSGFHSYPCYGTGLLRFLRGVWPPQAARFSDATLTVPSTHSTPDTEAAVRVAPRATLIGTVPDFASLFADHGFFAHPLLGGTGQKNRLAIALAQGACCLATDAAVSGMGLAPFEDYLPLGDLSERDAAVLGAALGDRELAATVAANGRRRIASEFSTTVVGKRLVDLYREAIELHVKPPC